MTNTSAIQLLRRDEVLAITGLSHATIYRDPTFPRPIRVGERASAWIAAEVRAWTEARIAERDAGRRPVDRVVLARAASRRPAKRGAA